MKTAKFLKSPLGMIGLIVLVIFFLAGVYAPVLASSKPFVVKMNGEWYFPWFRYLFFQGYYTKPVDIFFNLFMFTLPFMGIFWRKSLYILGLQFALFLAIWLFPLSDPASDIQLAKARQQKIEQGEKPDFHFEVAHQSLYKKLNRVTEALRKKKHHERITSHLDQDFKAFTPYELQKAEDELDLSYGEAKANWLNKQNIEFILWPLIREFHWQDDAGGDQRLNQKLPWYELTRINRKDLVASLLFGIRISLMVGVLAIAIALLIGIPIGALAGFMGGRADLLISRLIEVWEAMPAFFMLLLIVAILESKSIFIVIAVIGIFGWTTIARYIRGEFFKERKLPYVEACTVMGFSPFYTMMHHILPNAIPPVLTLLPFAILGAITSEAGLSFLGLGEEGSTSWGVLMDEGRQAFPGESYLLWPPAFMLTTLLVAIALVGDALRDVLDPKS
ncbi:MAG: ABC transporter permease [Chlamydiia bacterium]|nr:ABC transporter permease [Chlamydiia bacterium]